MGITVGVGLDVEERLSLVAPGGEAPRFITLERRWERVDGGALIAMVAHTGDPDLPIVRWDNPFRPAQQGHGVQWHDDEIGVAGCILSLIDAVRNDAAPSYGAQQARLDQELVIAIRQSRLPAARLSNCRSTLRRRRCRGESLGRHKAAPTGRGGMAAVPRPVLRRRNGCLVPQSRWAWALRFAFRFAAHDQHRLGPLSVSSLSRWPVRPRSP